MIVTIHGYDDDVIIWEGEAASAEFMNDRLVLRDAEPGPFPSQFNNPVDDDWTVHTIKGHMFDHAEVKYETDL